MIYLLLSLLLLSASESLTVNFIFMYTFLEDLSQFCGAPVTYVSVSESGM